MRFRCTDPESKSTPNPKTDQLEHELTNPVPKGHYIARPVIPFPNGRAGTGKRTRQKAEAQQRPPKGLGLSITATYRKVRPPVTPRTTAELQDPSTTPLTSTAYTL